MKAKKSYGQHFLNNEDIANKIANSLALSSTYDQLLEVGPGRGMLTKYLLEHKHLTLTVVDADRDMIFYMEENYPQLGDRIIMADFIKFKLKDQFNGNQFAIIGNFPYNISSQIVFKMIDHREQVPELVGMFQKEMAKRIVAEPGSKIYGVISVLTQAYYDGHYLFSVSNGNFDPPPKVQSAVIRLTRKENQDLGCDHKLFKAIVKLTFGQRRKMLRNTLKTYLKGDPLLEEEFFKQRPEQLSVQDFIKVTKWIDERRK